jgi:hypothetical protein
VTHDDSNEAARGTTTPSRQRRLFPNDKPVQGEESRVYARDSRWVDPSPPGLAQGDGLLCPGSPCGPSRTRLPVGPSGTTAPSRWITGYLYSISVLSEIHKPVLFLRDRSAHNLSNGAAEQAPH